MSKREKVIDPEFRFLSVLARSLGVHGAHIVAFIQPGKLLPNDELHPTFRRRGWWASALQDYFFHHPQNLELLARRAARLTNRDLGEVRSDLVAFLETGANNAAAVRPMASPQAEKVVAQIAAVVADARGAELSRAVAKAVEAGVCEFLAVLLTALQAQETNG